MSTFAAALKDEIRRLARKEISAQTETIKKAVAQRRRDIAELKRQNSALQKRISFLETQEKHRVAEKPSESLADKVRFSGNYVKTHRTKLGLSAEAYGELVGVSRLTIYNWESGKSRPRRQQLAAWVAIRNLKKREAQKRLELLG